MKSMSHTEREGVALTQLAFERLDLFFRPLDVHDVGIDAQVELGKDSRPTGEIFGVQIKAGKSWFSEVADDSRSFVFRESAKHFDYWLDHCLPVVVVLCDLEK